MKYYKMQEVYQQKKPRKKHTLNTDKFKLIQDKEYLSDFDKEIKNWKD